MFGEFFLLSSAFLAHDAGRSAHTTLYTSISHRELDEHDENMAERIVDAVEEAYKYRDEGVAPPSSNHGGPACGTHETQLPISSHAVCRNLKKILTSLEDGKIVGRMPYIPPLAVWGAIAVLELWQKRGPNSKVKK